MDLELVRELLIDDGQPLILVFYVLVLGSDMGPHPLLPVLEVSLVELDEQVWVHLSEMVDLLLVYYH